MKYSYFAYPLSNGASIGLGLGLLKGATDQGEVFTNPVTGERLVNRKNPLERAGSLVSNAAGGVLLGSVGQAGYRIYKKLPPVS